MKGDGNEKMLSLLKSWTGQCSLTRRADLGLTRGQLPTHMPGPTGPPMRYDSYVYTPDSTINKMCHH